MGACMANNHDWALTVVGDLLDGFGADPDASVLGLLALGYGQSVLLQAQWSDFDLQAGVWWVSGGALPLTAPFVALLKRYRRCCAGRGDRLFIGRKDRALSKTEANARVHEQTREFFNLGDLLDLFPDMGTSQWAQYLREYADLGAAAEQVEALEREFNRLQRSLLEAWHGDVLCVAAAMSARGFTR
jgi:integrase